MSESECCELIADLISCGDASTFYSLIILILLYSVSQIYFLLPSCKRGVYILFHHVFIWNLSLWMGEGRHVPCVSPVSLRWNIFIKSQHFSCIFERLRKKNPSSAKKRSFNVSFRKFSYNISTCSLKNKTQTRYGSYVPYTCLELKVLQQFFKSLSFILFFLGNISDRKHVVIEFYWEHWKVSSERRLKNSLRFYRLKK